MIQWDMREDESMTKEFAKGAALRFQTALDLMETSIAIMRQNIRRRSPDASDQAVLTELQRWLDESDETRTAKALA